MLKTGRFEFKLEMVVEPVIQAGPETVRAVEEALAKEEVAVAVMEVKEGLEEIDIWVEVPSRISLPSPVVKLKLAPRLRSPLATEMVRSAERSPPPCTG